MDGLSPNFGPLSTLTGGRSADGRFRPWKPDSDSKPTNSDSTSDLGSNDRSQGGFLSILYI